MRAKQQLGLLLASSVRVVYSASLIDTLKANGATQFALELQQYPEYLTPDIVTVFAPIDGSAYNASTLARRSVLTVQSQVSEVKTTVSTSGLRKRTNLTGYDGEVFANEHLNAKQETGRDNVIMETVYKILPPAKLRREANVEPAGWHSTSSYTSEVPTILPTAEATVQAVSNKTEPMWTSSTSASASSVPSTMAGTVPNPALDVASGLGNKVNVLRVNIPYDGGLIHLVDGYFTVPIPVSNTLEQKGLSKFEMLLEDASLKAGLDAEHDVTVFVPKNSALAAANISSLSSAELQGLANAHIVPNFSGYLPRLKDGDSLVTAAGTQITVRVSDGNVYISGVQIITPNIITDSGVIHVLDNVLPSTPVLSTTNSGWSLGKRSTLDPLLCVAFLLAIAILKP